jgi:hypothetical protein
VTIITLYSLTFIILISTLIHSNFNVIAQEEQDEYYLLEDEYAENYDENYFKANSIKNNVINNMIVENSQLLAK